VANYKLLLADDSVTIQKVVKLTFADEGIEVITAGDGDTALSLIEEDNPDIVLADVHMPGLSGYELCERLRSREDTRNVPVVLLVGSFEPFDESEFERVGANKYMTKPFHSIRELVATVSSLITPREIREAETLPIETIPIETPPDTSDIDSLYQQSVAAPDERPEAADLTDEKQGFNADEFGDRTTSELVMPEMEDSFEPPSPQVGLVEAGDDLSVEVIPGPQTAAEESRGSNASDGDGSPPHFGGSFNEEAAPRRFPEPARAPAAAADPRQEVKFRLEEAEDDILGLSEPVGSEPASPETSPAFPPTTGAAGQQVTLTPELIEAIAQRVAEKLAEMK
jgi:CheY-like chemotaxis protein